MVKPVVAAMLPDGDGAVPSCKLACICIQGKGDCTQPLTICSLDLTALGFNEFTAQMCFDALRCEACLDKYMCDGEGKAYPSASRPLGVWGNVLAVLSAAFQLVSVMLV